MKVFLVHNRTCRRRSSEYVRMKLLLDSSCFSQDLRALLLAYSTRARPAQKIQSSDSKFETKASESLVKIAFRDGIKASKQIQETSFGYIAIKLVRRAYILIHSKRPQLDHHEIKCMEARSIGFTLPLALSHKLMFTLDRRHYHRDQNSGHGAYRLHPRGPLRFGCAAQMSETQHAERYQHGHCYQRNVFPIEKQFLSEIATHHHPSYPLSHTSWRTESTCKNLQSSGFAPRSIITCTNLYPTEMPRNEILCEPLSRKPQRGKLDWMVKTPDRLPSRQPPHRPARHL